VVPHSPWHWQGKGCIEQIRLGARPIHRAKDVLELLEAAGLRGRVGPVQCELPLSGPSGAESHSPEPLSGMDPVLDALRSGACHADEIAERTGLSVVAVQQRILTLALSGVLVPGPWGSLKLVTS
jgi:DNA processing protein